jgi:flagella synthesis protein FlgN
MAQQTANTATDWSQLEQSLQADTALTQQLQLLLETEREQLEQRNYERFEALLGDKQTLLTALETNATARREQLAARGIDSETEALRQLAEQAPTIAADWHQLADLWRACQQANQINEQICLRTRSVVTRVLDLLHGQPGQGSTYDAKGLAHRLQNGRPISRA